MSDSIVDTLDREMHSRDASKVEPGTAKDIPSIPMLRGDVCSASASPSIECTISKFTDPKIRSKHIQVRLDMGADVTCIPKHLADSLKLDIRTECANTMRLFDASGNLMMVFGKTNVYLTPTHGSLINQTKKFPN